MSLRLRSYLPRGLYGRSALILSVPIVTIQLIVSIAFIQRHFEGATEQLAQGVIAEIAFVTAQIEGAGALPEAAQRAKDAASAFGMRAALPAEGLPAHDSKSWRDLTGGLVIAALREGTKEVISVTLEGPRSDVLLGLRTAQGDLALFIPRSRLSASNPHQFFVLIAFISALMTFVSYFFLRRQLRPITLLARAAEAFGKGQATPFRPRGAAEIRAAGNAFLDMRKRIEHAIEARTLLLSGISHDLRTPLTRLRLGLTMLEGQSDEGERAALLEDVAEMERMVEEFLAFARGDAMEQMVYADPRDIARQAVSNANRHGQKVDLLAWPAHLPARVKMRPDALRRALGNLIDNARCHARTVRLSLASDEGHLTYSVEDDGPGIPEEHRERAIVPFRRLDDARSPGPREARVQGSGTGLGLSIAADIARSHGGGLELDQSPALGGLRARLVIAR